MRFLTVPLALTLSTATPAFAEWKTLTTKAELQKLIVGKSWVNPRNEAWFRLRRNGKLDGASGQDKLAGAWAWKSQYLCFDRTLGGKKVPSDCVVVQVSGKQIATIRNQGKGRRSVYIRKQ